MTLQFDVRPYADYTSWSENMYEQSHSFDIVIFIQVVNLHVQTSIG